MLEFHDLDKPAMLQSFSLVKKELQSGDYAYMSVFVLAHGEKYSNEEVLVLENLDTIRTADLIHGLSDNSVLPVQARSIPKIFIMGACRGVNRNFLTDGGPGNNVGRVNVGRNDVIGLDYPDARVAGTAGGPTTQPPFPNDQHPRVPEGRKLVPNEVDTYILRYNNIFCTM